MKIVYLFFATILVAFSNVLKADGFVIKDIKIIGLNRVEAGNIFLILPFRINDYFDFASSTDLIRLLYEEGSFEDIELRYENDNLYIVVTERPGIASIQITGSDEVPEEAILEALEVNNIAPGQIYKYATYDRIEQELRKQYHALGKYAARIEVSTVALPDNQVNLNIRINENETTRIRDIAILGNRRLPDKLLTKNFESGGQKWYEFWKDKDRYSKFKLAADIESLQAIYLDHGYLDFAVEETTVTLTPDRRFIDILIKIKEGQPYRINRASLASSPISEQDEITEIINNHIKRNEIFSRKEALRASSEIGNILKDKGYAFAKIDAVPQPDAENRTVDVTFFPTPGALTYVRRINIHGNIATDDEVFRHELRQLESAPYSARKIELSKGKLRRLPFVGGVTVEEKPVEQTDNQVDLDFNIEERKSGSFNIGAGLSDSEGAVVTLQLSQANFLGTGNQVSTIFNNSKSNTRYLLRFTDPYHTIDGISRTLIASYSSVDYGERDVSRVDTEETNLSVHYGIPISELDTLGLGLRWEDIRYSGSEDRQDDLRECLGRENETAEQYQFRNYAVTAGLAYDTRDSALFPKEGARISSNLDIYGPGSGLKYYKINYSHRHFFPLDEDKAFVFSPRLLMSYADKYGNTPKVPCTDRFFAGGTKTIRGYLNNSLGPRNTFDDPEGGNFRTVGNFDLYFPTAFLYDPKRLRASIFTDIGNVYEDFSDFDISEFRGSVGLNISWITAIGAVTFNLATQYNDKHGDETESFQFDLGTNF